MKKIQDAVPMRNDQILAFQSFEATIPGELVAEWRAAVELWESDSNTPNPFKQGCTGIGKKYTGSIFLVRPV